VYGAYLVSVWLALIAISLIASGHYLDIAVRDLVMSASAYSLATLSRVHQEQSGTNYKQARCPNHHGVNWKKRPDSVFLIFSLSNATAESRSTSRIAIRGPLFFY
jgi:hypothetical protein